MAFLNRVELIGNIGRKPEGKFTATGKQVVSFSVAVNNSWKNDAGERQQSTEWVNCEAWGNTGKFVAEYLDKGTSVFVDGRLKTDVVGEGENKKYFTKVVVASIQPLTKAQSNSTTQNDGQNAPSQEDEEAFPF